MSDPGYLDNDFLKKVTAIIEENISDELFGVSELAQKVGMSRSNLLRKLKKSTNQSVSQYIRQIRLKKAMTLLKEESFTVSEVSFKVGFGSTSYFIKCFREQYGYPPGEANQNDFVENETAGETPIVRSHQLAAIMFTDIQGYTALMQQDENRALVIRNRHREAFNSITGRFKGKILQYYGDGTLSAFSSAIDAVKCGIELQLSFREEPRIPVRIGIHSGDIIFNKEEIIGDGVNVASRIESLALAGSVFISGKVYDEIKNQPGILARSLGEFELKNVDKPIEVFALANAGLLVPSPEEIVAVSRSKSSDDTAKREGPTKRQWLKWAIILLAILFGVYLLNTLDILDNELNQEHATEYANSRKSIAVLPFRNDSNDSSNIYIVNGLMESILNNLQQIKDLRVISRTSVEKYRNNSRTIPELARELNVNYFVEGSGQKIGDQILLHIQLIEAESDEHLSSKQYRKETKDIFQLQIEVARDIAGEIEAIITPEEATRINKTPTENVEAYDYFLKGLDLFYKGSPDDLREAIALYKQAIELDGEFARAYAGIAIAYFTLDANQIEKVYSEQINHYADQALLFDPQLPQSLIAKALFYMYHDENELALPYLEKALEYNPNSALVINILADFYTTKMPNTAKYLEYALKGVELDIAAHDSITASFIYLHLSNAFVQAGFVKEAKKYINKSLESYPENIYSTYVKAYVQYAQNEDLELLKESLVETLKKDTTRLDVLQEVGKAYYFLRDYESAYAYYKKFLDIKRALKLDIYPSEDIKMALVFSEKEMNAESEILLKQYKSYIENDKSIYKHLGLSAYYSYTGDLESSIEHMKLFSKEDDFFYWLIVFMDADPTMDNVKNLPAFKKIMKQVEKKFWNNHKEIRAALESKNLL